MSPPLLDAMLRRLVDTFAPERVILFGSWARGEATAESDVDLLVIARSAEPVHARMARAQTALRGLPVPADVFVCTPEEATRWSRWLGHTVAVAIREGKVVYG